MILYFTSNLFINYINYWVLHNQYM